MGQLPLSVHKHTHTHTHTRTHTHTHTHRLPHCSHSLHHFPKHQDGHSDARRIIQKASHTTSPPLCQTLKTQPRINCTHLLPPPAPSLAPPSSTPSAAPADTHLQKVGRKLSPGGLGWSSQTAEAEGNGSPHMGRF